MTIRDTGTGIRLTGILVRITGTDTGLTVIKINMRIYCFLVVIHLLVIFMFVLFTSVVILRNFV